MGWERSGRSVVCTASVDLKTTQFIARLVIVFKVRSMGFWNEYRITHDSAI